nr:plastidic ATP/ADP-transporter-like [Ipomoea batatas]
MGKLFCRPEGNTFCLYLQKPKLKAFYPQPQEKPKMGTMESFEVLGSLQDISGILLHWVVAYGISINLVEFPSPNEYSSFMGDFSTANWDCNLHNDAAKSMDL